jgi:hypothetical protein
MKVKGNVIKTKADAVEALAEATKLKDEAEALMQEHGITEMLETADELKKRATSFAASKGIDKLDLPDGRYGKLIQAVGERIWIGTKKDIPEGAPTRIKPLKSLVSKEVWMMITRRVPDPELIEQAVSDGAVTLDEIEPAYFEKMRAPYLRVFGSNNGEA